ncbi:MAG: glycosyltransferase [Deltaproteobacteria bacterium]
MVNSIKRVVLREPAVGSARIIAIFSYRYDAHLVPDLIANISPIVHGYAVWDDRGDHEHHSNEPMRRNALNAAALEMGADWILGIEPDERLETRARLRLHDIANGRISRSAWSLNLREMVRPDAWRRDGVWGKKTQVRFYPKEAVQRPLTRQLHGAWFNHAGGFETRHSDLNLYHLRHISPNRSQARRDTYAAADPHRHFNNIGYDYLIDDSALDLQTVSPRRAFQPNFVDDGDLWGPTKDYGTLLLDPDISILRLMERSLRSNGAAAAEVCLQKLIARHPADQDYIAMVQLISKRRALNKHTQGHQRWRRWINGNATVSEGANNGTGPLATVILSFRAAKTVSETVKILRAQSPTIEIVVVNSGGGNMAEVLGEWLNEVRLIDIEQPLFVGAIRNIGIDASSAPYVSFLAADCIPMPGWVAGRIARHESGTLSVSSAVLAMRPGTLTGDLVESLRLAARLPHVGSDDALHYGRSYNRAVFDVVGYFAPGLQIGEDSEFHQRLDRIEAPVWAPEIAIRHRDPTSVIGFLLDAKRRAKSDVLSAFNYARDQGQSEGRLRVYRERAEESRLSRPHKSIQSFILSVAQSAFLSINKRAMTVGVRRLLRAEVLRVSGRLALGLGRCAEAQSVVGQAVALDPNNIEGHLLLGLTWLAQNSPKHAMSAFQHALDLWPSRTDVVASAIKALRKAGYLSEAGVLLERVLLIAPLHADIQKLAAEAAVSAGQYDAALNHARIALILSPASPETHSVLAKIHDELGNFAQAELRRRSAAELT